MTKNSNKLIKKITQLIQKGGMHKQSPKMDVDSGMWGWLLFLILAVGVGVILYFNFRTSPPPTTTAPKTTNPQQT
tara:strand:- start:155 stop:379 length:225 start_codon:yes stop_codon:yes gene_type:complete